MLQTFDDDGFIIVTDERSQKVKELVNNFSYLSLRCRIVCTSDGIRII